MAVQCPTKYREGMDSNDPRISRYRDAAASMSQGHYDVDLPIGDPGDVAQLGSALEALSHALEKRFGELQALLHVTEAINSGLILDEVLDNVFTSFRPIIPYDRIGLALIDPDGQTVRARWARSDSPTIRIHAGYSARLDGSSLQEVIRTMRPRILSDLEGYLREHPASDSTRRIVEEGMRSSLTCPLVVTARPVGFLFFSSMKPGAYNDIHAGLFQQIAGQVSSIVEKGRLYQTVFELNQELLRSNAELQAANATILQIMNADPLTGLLNRRGFFDIMRKALSLSKRARLPLSLVMVDLDRFKEVNDRYGHLAGDELLTATAQLLVRCSRQEDSVCRFGGEEFLVLLPNTALENATLFCERVRQSVLQLSTPVPNRTASLGVTELNETDTPDSLIARADRAMYRAKETGRNRTCTETR